MMYEVENENGLVMTKTGEYKERSKISAEDILLTADLDHTLFPGVCTFRDVSGNWYKVCRGEEVLVFDEDAREIYFKSPPLEPWEEYFRFWSPLEEDFRRHMKRFGKDFGEVTIKKEGH